MTETFLNFYKKKYSKIFSLDSKTLTNTIYKSCKIKLNFTEKDFKEKD